MELERTIGGMRIPRIIALFLLASLASIGQTSGGRGSTSVSWSVIPSLGQAAIVVYVQNPEMSHTAYMATVAWAAGPQSGSTTQIVKRVTFPNIPSFLWSSYLVVHAPAKPEDVKITRIQVTPVVELDPDSVLLTPGHGLPLVQ